MKLKIIFIILISTFAINAQNNIWIDTAAVKPGQQATLSIKMGNSNKITAFQMDIQLPSNVVFDDTTLVLNSIRKVDHAISSTLMPNNILRVIAYSASKKSFNGISGALASFKVNTALPSGDFYLQLSNVILSDSANHNVLNSSYNGLVKILAPKISINRNFDFGSVQLGNSSSQNFQFYNSGNDNLSITKITSNTKTFYFQDSSAMTVTPNNYNYRTIVFNPTKKGFFSGQIKVYSNDPTIDSIFTINVSGTAFTVNELRANSVTGRNGQEVEISFYINNQEKFSAFEYTLNLPSVLKYKYNSQTLLRKLDHQLYVDTLSGNRLKIVAMSPSNKNFTGSSGDIIKLRFNVAGLRGTYNYDIQNAIIGDSTGKNILSGYSGSTLNLIGPSLTVNSSNIDFGSVSIFDSTSQNVIINNAGNDTLRVDSIKIDVNKYSSSATFPRIILPGQNYSLPVKVRSSVKGVYISKLYIYNNDVQNSSQIVNLTATVFNPNIINILSARAMSQDTAWIPIEIKNSEPVVAFQFDITMPDSIPLLPGSVQLTSRAGASHSISCTSLGGNNYRVIAYSMNQTPFSGDSGAVCRVQGVLNRVYGLYPMSLSNCLIGNSQNQNVVSSYNGVQLNVLPRTKITGKITYDNTLQTALSNVKLLLMYNLSIRDSAYTDANGNYSFLYVPNGNFSIALSSSQTWGGANATDALLIRRYTAGLYSINGLKWRAGDVNGSNTVNTADALMLRQKVAGIISSFTVPYWLFETASLTIAGIDASKSIKGICAGDVNASYAPVSKSASIKFSPGRMPVKDKQNIEYPLYLSSNTTIGALTLYLNYNIGDIEVLGITSKLEGMLYTIKDGKISIAWDDINGATFASKEPLVTLHLTGKRSVSNVSISVDPESELADVEGNPLPEINITGIDNNETEKLTSYSLEQNYPNPFNPSTKIKYAIPFESNVKLIIYNLLGEVVTELVNKVQKEGIYELKFDASNLPSGMYIYSIKACSINGNKNFSSVKKMLLIK